MSDSGAARRWVERAGVVPVLRGRSTAEALAVTAAMVDGGITVVEVTTTLPDAAEVLRELRARYGSTVLLGAGTVCTRAQCEAMLEAGAEFVVSPGCVPEVIAAARARGILMVAGALTPTEILRAWELGAQVIKVFPCSAMGGAGYLRALAGPFPEIPLLPTGGITLATARSFLEAGAVALGVGSDLVDTAAVRAGREGEVTAAARAYCAVVEGWHAEAAVQGR